MNKPTPAEALAATCQVETIERNGFKAVILRLRGDGYFRECLEELRHLVKSHQPTIQPDGTVSHFLVFDLKQVGLITDSLPGVFLLGLRGGVATPTGIVLAVCLIHPNEQQKSIMRLARLENLLPWFSNEQAAFDAMSPAGFPSTISFIEKKSSRCQADLAEAAKRRVQAVPGASPPLSAPNVGHGVGPDL